MNGEYFSRRFLFSVSWKRVVLILAVLLPVFVVIFLISLRLPEYSRLGFAQVLMWFVIAAIILTTVIEMILLSNERLIRTLISAMFILILFFGIMFFTDADIALLLVPLAATLLIVFWMLNQLPAVALALLILTICCAVLLQIVFFPAYPRYVVVPLQPQSQLYGSIGSICFGCLVFACVYFPRRLQWKRLLYPYRLQPRPVKDRVEKDEHSNGYTLIELLIVAAIIGILSTGLFSVWAHAISTQRNMEQRAQIAEILNSEMNALMTSSESAAPTKDLQPLPIPLSDFGDRLRLTGGFIVAETEQPGVVRITVIVTQDLDQPALRHFRMVSHRCLRAKTEL